MTWQAGGRATPRPADEPGWLRVVLFGPASPPGSGEAATEDADSDWATRLVDTTKDFAGAATDSPFVSAARVAAATRSTASSRRGSRCSAPRTGRPTLTDLFLRGMTCLQMTSLCRTKPSPSDVEFSTFGLALTRGTAGLQGRQAGGRLRDLQTSLVGCVWYSFVRPVRRAAALEPDHREPTANTP